MPTKNRFTTTQSPSNKTAITLNIYDLLPPGPLSTLLWTLGSSLLHSGVQITPPNTPPTHHVAREYAYGGHNRRATTGVYYTPPLQTPPGGTFRTSILIGHTTLTPPQIDSAVREISNQFLGTSYNLLTNNCNHFSSALLLRLTGKTAPRWLNRAAGVGLAVPCMVPKEWVGPALPSGVQQQTAEGDLLSPDPGEDDEDEEAAMLDFDRRRQEREQRRRERGRRSRQVSAGNIVVPVPERSEDQVRGGDQEERGGSRERSGGQGGGSAQQDGGADEVGSSLAGGPKITGPVGTPPPRLVSVRDTSGRAVPVAERAPVPAKLR
ncbi:hypothetical protein LTR15_005644 [Elasticomyces elasticus]|nr:hypothetical protein LTR15_005644 [Elasticomyces elasticus]